MSAYPLPKPPLLMVSHCIPDCGGTPDRRRSWQLLEAAARTHRVWLAATVDGAVSLTQWRAAARLAEAVALTPCSPASVPGEVPGGRGGREEDREALPASYGQVAFEVVLCTSARGWSTAGAVAAPLRICDFGGAASRRSRARTGVIGAGLRWWRAWQARAEHERERAVAARCDVLLVSHAQDAARWADLARTVHLVPRRDASTLTTLLRPALPPNAQLVHVIPFRTVTRAA